VFSRWRAGRGNAAVGRGLRNTFAVMQAGLSWLLARGRQSMAVGRGRETSLLWGKGRGIEVVARVKNNMPVAGLGAAGAGHALVGARTPACMSQLAWVPARQLAWVPRLHGCPHASLHEPACMSRGLAQASMASTNVDMMRCMCVKMKSREGSRRNARRVHV